MGIFNASTATPESFVQAHGHALIEGEEVVAVFKTIRDFIAFTSWRLIYVDIQGLTGSKKQYLSVPYRSINAFAIESAGTFDLDGEIKLFLSGHEPITFRIARDSDVGAMQNLLAAKLGA